MIAEKIKLLRTALQPKGSVTKAIFKHILWCGAFGFLISLLHHFEKPVSQPILANVIPSIVLGLLLVFRTNTAYERFWEGRKCWGSIVNNTRNLARQIWVSVDEILPEDKDKKITALNLLAAFAVTTKLHLRGETVNSELEDLMPSTKYIKLKIMNNPPIEVAFWIGDYLQEQYNRNCLNSYQLTSMQELLNNLVDNLGACERILKTPMPLAYALHLKQLLILYCFLLPFQIVEKLGWWTGLISALVGFTVFGIEAIGLEIENPFGYDANDLPLDAICETMKRNIDDLITLTPNARSHQQDSITN
ncbi:MULTISPECIES: bestrophin family protein [unclassified Nostoc]|uniref:bestrophin family protein n=1 Tax=unclassified Nostoc TaxID=2593658 RepID=UPI002AD3C692|nr:MULTISPECIES: bestrophin family ion channel [unclassified Nostoc]MDZ8032031.1 bestrophin family ion channel [Nostoc sp. DedSLP04]MDZ8094456.1 bestrophin family ion channel [Nostoc sp. DedQUE05]MDZ8131605.1 bestrophin family ion channel [Nostoc sp. DedQUE07]MDZ8133767.1 bestrophin family ion channel [Nostoc sp. DedQUE04]